MDSQAPTASVPGVGEMRAALLRATAEMSADDLAKLVGIAEQRRMEREKQHTAADATDRAPAVEPLTDKQKRRINQAVANASVQLCLDMALTGFKPDDIQIGVIAVPKREAGGAFAITDGDTVAERVNFFKRCIREEYATEERARAAEATAGNKAAIREG